MNTLSCYTTPLITSKIKALSTHLLEGKREVEPSSLINHSIYPEYYATGFLGFLFLRLLRQSSPEMGKPAAKDFCKGEKNQKNIKIPIPMLPTSLMGNPPLKSLLIYTLILKYISNDPLTFTGVFTCRAWKQ